MLDSLALPFVQRGIAVVLLLSVAAGLLGTWIVLRGLAFLSHAAGTAAFPGLVLADGLGFAPAAGAVGGALALAGLVGAVSPRRGDERGTATALVLVGMLAAGALLASDVFESGAGVDSLLFGSLLLVDGTDLALAGGSGALVGGLSRLAGPRWLARGFDSAEGAPGARSGPWPDLLLLALVAVTVAAALTAVGALLVAALLVVPAATTRPFCGRMGTWQLATVALVAAVGVAGVLISVQLNAPPGATIAVLAGAVFALALAGRALAPRLRPAMVVGVAAALALAVLAAGCGRDDGGAGPRVLATTTQLADVATQVGEPHVEVEGVLGPGADAHDYELRPADVKAAAGADVVLASGGGIDAWSEELIAQSGSDAEVVRLLDRVPHRIPGDPHWWHDPRNVAAAATLIGDRLASIAPRHSARIERSARSYASEVRRLDRRIASCMAAIPPANRKLVTDHEAFAYLARRYGLEVVGTVIPAVSTRAQPSAGELAELRETIERENVPAVFVEQSVSGDAARAIARETGASAEHTLYGDALGPEGSEAASWTGMMAANADAIVRGLTDGERGCEPR